MMLGEVLREARRAAAVLDPALCAKIEETGEPAGDYARAAVAVFERYASEEDWATIMSAIRSAEDPGKACLELMVSWRLRHSAARAPERATNE